MQSNKSQVSNTNLFIRLNFYFTCLLILWTLTPYLMRNLQQELVILLFLGWWLSAFLYLYTKKTIFINRREKIIPVTIIWLIIISLYVVVLLPNFSFGNYFYIILYYMPIFFLVFYIKFGNYIFLKKVLFFSILVIIFNSVINIWILLGNPYAAKEATGRYGLIDYTGTNVITDQFAFAIVLGVYLGVLGVRFPTFKWSKITYISFILVLIFMLVQSTFFIALISLVIILTSYFLLKGNQFNSILKGLLTLLVFTLLFIFKSNIANIAKDWILLLTTNDIIITRVYLLSDLISNYTISGTLEARIDNIKSSLTTLSENPMFGKGYIVDFYSSDTGIGNHSYIFDNLARLGFVGFFFELLVYVFFYRYMSSLINNSLKKYYLCSWGGFIFYALFNPIAYPSTGIMLFFVFPLFVYFLSLKIDKNI